MRTTVFLPIFLYSITASMFFPVIQSFLYAKVCLHTKNDPEICNQRGVARDKELHKQANYVLLIGSVVMCCSGFLSSSFIGKVGDTKSRRTALLLPFFGLLIADVFLMILVYYEKVSPYLFVLSELSFGIFGGYMAIFSSAFSYITSLPKCTNLITRGQHVAWMEGTLGVGAFVGLIISSQLAHFSYFQMICFFTSVHATCVALIVTLDDHSKESLPDVETVPLEAEAEKTNIMKSNSILLLTAFGLSFFSMIGTAHILFFYLKQRFFWDAEHYSYFKASVQATSTIMTLFLYPWLKRRNFKDTTLAVFGLTMRILAKAWMAVAWSPAAVFGAVVFEMFGRFPATSLRSLIATNSARGAAFAKVGSLEAGCNLVAAIVFHLLFPWSIDFLPQLSFIIMSVLIIPGAVAVWWKRSRLDG